MAEGNYEPVFGMVIIKMRDGRLCPMPTVLDPDTGQMYDFELAHYAPLGEHDDRGRPLYRWLHEAQECTWCGRSDCVLPIDQHDKAEVNAFRAAR
jgi:hypothetical protein